jgi:hypothetical protein
MMPSPVRKILVVIGCTNGMGVPNFMCRDKLKIRQISFDIQMSLIDCTYKVFYFISTFSLILKKKTSLDEIKVKFCRTVIYKY